MATFEARAVRGVGRGFLLPRTLVCVVLLLSLPAWVHAQPPGPNRAGLVVVHGDGSVVARCVAFSEESISGAELLRRSGLSVVATSFGGLGQAVCAIDGEGCPPDDCFCQCKGGTCRYWTYSHLQADGTWVLSPVGAGAWQVRDGDVDGWVWGDGSVAPPPTTFEAVCGSLIPAPVQTDEPTPTAAGPVESGTPSPTAEPEATPTVRPSPSPSLTSAGAWPTPSPSLSPTPPALASPTPPVVAPTAPVSGGEGRGGGWNYALFAALVVILVSGLIWSVRRRG